MDKSSLAYSWHEEPNERSLGGPKLFDAIIFLSRVIIAKERPSLMKPKPYRAETSVDKNGNILSERDNSDASVVATIRWKYAPKASVRHPTMCNKGNLDIDRDGVCKPVTTRWKNTHKAFVLRSQNNFQQKLLSRDVSGSDNHEGLSAREDDRRTRKAFGQPGPQNMNGHHRTALAGRSQKSRYDRQKRPKPITAAAGFFLDLAGRVMDAVHKAKSHFPIRDAGRCTNATLLEESDLLEQIIIVKKDEHFPVHNNRDNQSNHPVPKNSKVAMGYSIKAKNSGICRRLGSDDDNLDCRRIPDETRMLEKCSQTSLHGKTEAPKKITANGNKSSRSTSRAEDLDGHFHAINDTSRDDRNRSGANHPSRRSLRSLAHRNRTESIKSIQSENSHKSRGDKSVASNRSVISRPVRSQHGDNFTSVHPKNRRRSRDDNSVKSHRSTASRSARRRRDGDIIRRDYSKTCHRSHDDKSVASNRSATSQSVGSRHDDDLTSVHPKNRRESRDDNSVVSHRSTASRPARRRHDGDIRRYHSKTRHRSHDDKSVACHGSIDELSERNRYNNDTDSLQEEKRSLRRGGSIDPERSRAINRRIRSSERACVISSHSTAPQGKRLCHSRSTTGGKDPQGVKNCYDSDLDSSEKLK